MSRVLISVSRSCRPRHLERGCYFGFRSPTRFTTSTGSASSVAGRRYVSSCQKSPAASGNLVVRNLFFTVNYHLSDDKRLHTYLINLHIWQSPNWLSSDLPPRINHQDSPSVLPTFQTMYDRVLVSDSAKGSVPSPVYLSRFVGRNGLTSKSVMVADSRTVVVKGFTFRGLAPGREGLARQGWKR